MQKPYPACLYQLSLNIMEIIKFSNLGQANIPMSPFPEAIWKAWNLYQKTVLVENFKMKDKEKIRNAILSAASSLFERFGYEKTSMEEIAEAIHKAKASIYYHFPSKLDIFREVLRKEMEGVITSQENIISSNPDPSSQLIAYLKSRMEVIFSAKVFMHYIMSPYLEGQSEVKEAIEEARKTLDGWEYGYFVDAFNKGREAGILSEAVKPDAFGKTMLVILKGLEIQFKNYEDKQAMRSTYDALVEVLVTNNFTNGTTRNRTI